SGTWSDTMGQQVKETLTFLDDDIARFMDEAIARRGQRPAAPPASPDYYEQALRVLGRYMDEQKPRDVFFLEQDGNFVLRLLMSSLTTASGAAAALAPAVRESNGPRPPDPERGSRQPSVTPRQRHMAELAVVGLMVIWAGNFIVVKDALNELPPVGFTTIRFLLATAALFVVCRIREGSVSLPRRDLLPIA